MVCIDNVSVWYHFRNITTFWATICKRIRPMLSDPGLSCLSVPSCLSVTLVYCTWSNGWMDHVETWHADRPRSCPQCLRLRWGPSSSSPKGHSPQFSAHICCGQMAGWTKMPLGMEVGLGPCDCVRRGPSSPSQKRRQSPRPNFRPISIVAKRLGAPRCHLVWR